MDIDRWHTAYVCCSGSFRLERALTVTYPHLTIRSNDVSIYSTALGRLAVGDPLEFEFVNELAFCEDYVAGASDQLRVAAVLVACQMSRYATRKNRYAKRHFDYYMAHFADLTEQTARKLDKTLSEMRVASYFCGDWQDHAYAGIDEGAGILAFPPFIKGDYEAQFRFVDENIAWEKPSYSEYDPSQLRDIVRGFEERGATYCVLTDQRWDDREPVLQYSNGRKVPHFCYASTTRSSVRHRRPKAEQFRYTPIDVDKLKRESNVEVAEAKGAALNFIKDAYVAKYIIHTPGLSNYLVWVDGMLLGCIVFYDSPTTRAAYGDRTLYLLSDVTTSNKGKVSKLACMIAKSRTLVGPLERKFLKRYERIVTTARTHAHSSMKYRGPYKKLSKRVADDPADGYVIQYAAPVVGYTPQEIYREWWDKHGPRAT